MIILKCIIKMFNFNHRVWSCTQIFITNKNSGLYLSHVLVQLQYNSHTSSSSKGGKVMYIIKNHPSVCLSVHLSCWLLTWDSPYNVRIISQHEAPIIHLHTSSLLPWAQMYFRLLTAAHRRPRCRENLS